MDIRVLTSQNHETTAGRVDVEPRQKWSPLVCGLSLAQSNASSDSAETALGVHPHKSVLHYGQEWRINRQLHNFRIYIYIVHIYNLWGCKKILLPMSAHMLWPYAQVVYITHSYILRYTQQHPAA
jgi:hypothetical protein